MLSLRFVRFFQYITPKTIRKTIVASSRQRFPGLAAEIAYNAMLSFFPTILAILASISLFAPLKQTFEELATQLSEVAPEEALWLIQGFANAISTRRDTGLFSLSFVFALWTASAALSSAMSALDRIHQTPLEFARPFWKARLVSIGLTIGAILLLLLSLGLVFLSNLTVLNVAQQTGAYRSPVLYVWRLFTLPLVLVIMSITFAFIYRFGPSRWNPGQPIMPGAVLAAIFWAILSNLFRLYVRYFGNFNRVYGTVGAFIVLMLWLYMSALILLVGGQLNVIVGEAMRSEQISSRGVK